MPRAVAFVDEEARGLEAELPPISAVTSSSTTSASIAPLGLVMAPIGSIEPAARPWVGGGLRRRRRAPSPRDRPAFLGRHHQLAARHFAEATGRSAAGRRAGAGTPPPPGWCRRSGGARRPPASPPANWRSPGRPCRPRPPAAGGRPARRSGGCGHAGEGHAVGRARRRSPRPRPARRPGRPGLRRVDQQRAALAARTVAPPHRRRGRCAGGWRTAATRDRPCEPRPCASASTSARAVAAAIAGWAPARCSAASTQPLGLGDRNKAHDFSAVQHRSAIRKLTRSLDSAVTPAMCGVSSRFGQPWKCGLAGSGSVRRRRSRRRPGGRCAARRPAPPRRRCRRVRC
jgi:hypothetical protein